MKEEIFVCFYGIVKKIGKLNVKIRNVGFSLQTVECEENFVTTTRGWVSY